MVRECCESCDWYGDVMVTFVDYGCSVVGDIYACSLRRNVTGN